MISQRWKSKTTSKFGAIFIFINFLILTKLKMGLVSQKEWWLLQLQPASTKINVSGPCLNWCHLDFHILNTFLQLKTASYEVWYFIANPQFNWQNKFGICHRMEWLESLQNWAWKALIQMPKFTFLLMKTNCQMIFQSIKVIQYRLEFSMTIASTSRKQRKDLSSHFVVEICKQQMIYKL